MPAPAPLVLQTFLASQASNDYLPVLVMFGFGIVFAAGSLGASAILGERGRKLKYKDRPYECGMPVQSHAHERFSVKFYLLAILFIVFDVEVVFLFPWAVAQGAAGGARALDTATLMGEMALFAGVLFIGWYYVVKKGVLEWHRDE